MGGGADYVGFRPRDAREAAGGGTTGMPRKERGLYMVLVERQVEHGDFEVGSAIGKALRAWSLKEHKIYSRERIRNGMG